MPYARCNVQYSFLLPSPGWVCVWGSSQDPVRVQQFLAKKNMEDGNMTPRAGHMWGSTVGTFLCWKDQNLKAANVWVKMYCHRQRNIDPSDPSIIKHKRRSADLALMAQATGS